MRSISSLLIIFLCCTSSSWAQDVVQLRNGKKVIGTIVIDDDLIWWETLKAFAVENAKSNVNTEDFILDDYQSSNKENVTLIASLNNTKIAKNVPSRHCFLLSRHPEKTTLKLS